ncbi:galactokinase [Christiangramia fulva]|uniref:Galactokinase n=1 Tax=Christiangramia fulva TaxID=2126553 RepID=A0A2R3Z9Q7_9FLAO|nr:galactokinase [Christiangramia fulva]AVR46997.1 galactokinase [Christiangramia fulva]
MKHIRTFQKKPEDFANFNASLSVHSPGRINLIGEHTDYNEGFVLPSAIDKKIKFQFRPNNTENFCRIFSETFGKGFEFRIDEVFEKQAGWENYILGVLEQLKKMGKTPGGFDCILKSELPVGAGISSSAALECGLAAGLNELFNLGLSKLDIVKLSQKAENEFVGNNCGIMDQYASVMSKSGNLILLDCRDLHSEYIHADFKNCSLLLLNTKVSHSLADSEYNTRRAECEKAVSIIQKDHPEVKSLRDVDHKTLENYKKQLDEKIYRRSLYVIEENERVIEATKALKEEDLKQFGRLMYQSHEGLQHQYEVSCKELDFMVDFSRDKNYIYGSRMMGGGFGGCTINLIENEHIDHYSTELSRAYKEKYGIDPDVIKVLPDAGTTVVKEAKP